MTVATHSGWSTRTSSDYGVVAALGAGHRREASARRAAAITERVDLTYPKVRHAKIDATGGTGIDADGMIIARQRAYTAYLATLAYYGLPFGSVAVPCYLCGDVFDAWTMDTEHVLAREAHGTSVGALMLSCHGCNADKRTRGIAPSIVEDIWSRTRMVGLVRDDSTTTGNVLAFWRARTRRADGSEMASTPM